MCVLSSEFHIVCAELVASRTDSTVTMLACWYSGSDIHKAVCWPKKQDNLFHELFGTYCFTFDSLCAQLCACCREKGAMIGCLHKGCNQNFHYMCAVDKSKCSRVES